MTCMHQCKIFRGYSRSRLENDVNKWLKENHKITIFDITYSNNRGGKQTVFITYDPNDYSEE